MSDLLSTFGDNYPKAKRLLDDSGQLVGAVHELFVSRINAERMYTMELRKCLEKVDQLKRSHETRFETDSLGVFRDLFEFLAADIQRRHSHSEELVKSFSEDVLPQINDCVECRDPQKLAALEHGRKLHLELFDSYRKHDEAVVRYERTVRAADDVLVDLEMSCRNSVNEAKLTRVIPTGDRQNQTEGEGDQFNRQSTNLSPDGQFNGASGEYTSTQVYALTVRAGQLIQDSNAAEQVYAKSVEGVNGARRRVCDEMGAVYETLSDIIQQRQTELTESLRRMVVHSLGAVRSLQYDEAQAAASLEELVGRNVVSDIVSEERSEQDKKGATGNSESRLESLRRLIPVLPWSDVSLSINDSKQSKSSSASTGFASGSLSAGSPDTLLSSQIDQVLELVWKVSDESSDEEQSRVVSCAESLVADLSGSYGGLLLLCSRIAQRGEKLQGKTGMKVLGFLANSIVRYSCRSKGQSNAHREVNDRREGKNQIYSSSSGNTSNPIDLGASNPSVNIGNHSVNIGDRSSMNLSNSVQQAESPRDGRNMSSPSISLSLSLDLEGSVRDRISPASTSVQFDHKDSMNKYAPSTTPPSVSATSLGPAPGEPCEIYVEPVRAVAQFCQTFYYEDVSRPEFVRKRYLQGEVYHNPVWSRVSLWQQVLILSVIDELVAEHRMRVNRRTDVADSSSSSGSSSGFAASGLSSGASSDAQFSRQIFSIPSSVPGVDAFGGLMLMFGIPSDNVRDLIKRVMKKLVVGLSPAKVSDSLESENFLTSALKPLTGSEIASRIFRGHTLAGLAELTGVGQALGSSVDESGPLLRLPEKVHRDLVTRLFEGLETAEQRQLLQIQRMQRLGENSDSSP